MTDEKLTAEETARRRDDALRRALSMPPKPHAGKKSSAKKRAVKVKKA